MSRDLTRRAPLASGRAHTGNPATEEIWRQIRQIIEVVNDLDAQFPNGDLGALFVAQGDGTIDTLSPGDEGEYLSIVDGVPAYRAAVSISVPGAANTVLLSNGNGGMTAVAMGNTGDALRLRANVPTWESGNLPGSNGYVLLSNGTGWARALTTGTNGQILTVSANMPTWANAATMLTPGDVNLRGTYASRPSAGTAGRTYRGTDTPLVWYDTGSVWVPAGIQNPMTEVPGASNFTTYQTGSNGTIVDDKGTLTLTETKRVAGEDKIVFVSGLTSGTGTGSFSNHTAYTFTVGLYVFPQGDESVANSVYVSGNSVCGICNFHKTNKSQQFIWLFTSTSGYRCQVGDAASLTGGISSNFTNEADTALMGQLMWLRIVDSGAASPGSNAVTFWVSQDGFTWHQVWRKNRVDGHTAGNYPDAVGLIINAPNSWAKARIFSYEWTSP